MFPSAQMIAPEPILRAGNDTVSSACVFVRNQTVYEGASTKMINEMMDAIHEVPRMLTDWRPEALTDVRMHFGGFKAERWAGAPDLVAFCDQQLRKYGYEEGAA